MENNYISYAIYFSVYTSIFPITTYRRKKTERVKNSIKYWAVCTQVLRSQIFLKSYETADKTLQNKLKQLARQALDRWVWLLSFGPCSVQCDAFIRMYGGARGNKPDIQSKSAFFLCVNLLLPSSLLLFPCVILPYWMVNSLGEQS